METGRWVGAKWEDRICAQCYLGKVEDVEHYIYLVRCGSIVREKEVLDKRMEELVDDYQDQ